MMYEKLNKVSIKDELVDAFKVYDRDANGEVSLTELWYFLTNFGPKMSHEEVDIIMEKADKDGDGNIDIEEFLNLLFDWFNYL